MCVLKRFNCYELLIILKKSEAAQHARHARHARHAISKTVCLTWSAWSQAQHDPTAKFNSTANLWCKLDELEASKHPSESMKTMSKHSKHPNVQFRKRMTLIMLSPASAHLRQQDNPRLCMRRIQNRSKQQPLFYPWFQHQVDQASTRCFTFH